LAEPEPQPQPRRGFHWAVPTVVISVVLLASGVALLMVWRKKRQAEGGPVFFDIHLQTSTGPKGVYAVSEAGGPRHVAAAGFAGGKPLSALLGGAPLAPDPATHLLTEAAAALGAAHAAGLVHGDLRPASILADPQGAVRIEGFAAGQAHAGSQPAPPLESLLYRAPEVVSGLPPSAASDLYALGAIFYHLLAGRPPHDFSTPEELSVKLITETPPPLHQLAPHVNRHLIYIVERLIAKTPSDRFASAADLLSSLTPHRGPHSAHPSHPRSPHY
jgi:serine/threonine-protein kinase